MIVVPKGLPFSRRRDNAHHPRTRQYYRTASTIARFGLARRAVDLLDTFSPRQAASEAIAEFEAETGGRAGVLVLDHEGRVGREHNTAAMQTARTERD